MTVNEAWIMQILRDSAGAVTASEIFDEMTISQCAINGNLSSLRRRGYVTGKRNAGMMLLVLTFEGRVVADQIFGGKK